MAHEFPRSCVQTVIYSLCSKPLGTKQRHLFSLRSVFFFLNRFFSFYSLHQKSCENQTCFFFFLSPKPPTRVKASSVANLPLWKHLTKHLMSFQERKTTLHTATKPLNTCGPQPVVKLVLPTEEASHLHINRSPGGQVSLTL